MNGVSLQIPEEEAKNLYRVLHRSPRFQETYCETYRMLQSYFFQVLTVEEITTLLEDDE